MSIEGKVIVVTGGAGLLGSVLAKAITVAGGIVMIADIDIQRARILVERLNIEIGKPIASFTKMNITVVEDIHTCISETIRQFGRIDGLVNSAYPTNALYGIKVEDVTYESFCDNVTMHLGGYFLVSQQFSIYFKKAGGGSIVTISSIYGIMAPRFEVYNGTEMTMPVEYAPVKAGLLHLMRYLAKYFKGTNIRFNSISPGGIYSGQPDSFVQKYNNYCLNKGMLDGIDIAGTLIFLLSDESKFVNGQNIIVDDGYSL
jgi:NAD(P)-dependent dehydrogenase (short-subunit alcohol dehydrogenase family)